MSHLLRIVTRDDAGNLNVEWHVVHRVEKERHAGLVSIEEINSDGKVVRSLYTESEEGKDGNKTS